MIGLFRCDVCFRDDIRGPADAKFVFHRCVSKTDYYDLDMPDLIEEMFEDMQPAPASQDYVDERALNF